MSETVETGHKMAVAAPTGTVSTQDCQYLKNTFTDRQQALIPPQTTPRLTLYSIIRSAAVGVYA